MNHYKGSGLEPLVPVSAPLAKLSVESRRQRDVIASGSKPDVVTAEDHEHDADGEPDDDAVNRRDRDERVEIVEPEQDGRRQHGEIAVLAR